MGLSGNGRMQRKLLLSPTAWYAGKFELLLFIFGLVSVRVIIFPGSENIP